MKAEAERFLESLAPRCAAKTILSHRTWLGVFSNYCAERGLGAPSEAGKNLLEDYGHWLEVQPTKRRGREMAYATKVIALRSARQFLVWAYEIGEAWFDFSAFSVAAAGPRVGNVPSVAVMKRLLSLPDLGEPVGCRDRLALELLYVLGLRRSECEALELEDLDLGGAALRVRGKGGHERRLPMSPGFLQTLSRYLEDARPVLARAGETALLVRESDGRRLSGGSLYHVLTGYGKRLGLSLYPHQLRHACATHLLEAGMEVRLIAEFLGHGCLQSTRRYAQVRRQALQREFRRCHPRASFSNLGQ